MGSLSLGEHGAGWHAASDPEGADAYRLLDEEGRLVGPDPELGPELLVALFASMVRTRAFDRRATALRRQGRIGEYYRCEGQEALAGAALALAPEDWIFTAYRDQPAWFARGLPYDAVLETYTGLPPEHWDTERYRITRLNATIGTHLPHAVGFTHAARMRGESLAALVLFSDGATSEADFHSGLNFAGVWRTPTVFLCQNNQYAQSVALKHQTAGVIASKAIGYGMPGVRVDGMDPLAMHVAARDALERARSGEGPTLIEMVCYRYHGHATFESNPLPYRPPGEPEAWMAKDPIERLRKHLLSRDLVTEEQEEAWIAEVQQQCEVAMERLEARALPPRVAAIRNTYAKVPAPVLRHLRQVQEDLGEEPAELPEDELFQPAEEGPLPSDAVETITHVRAIRDALYEGMRRNDGMVCIGEDVAADGGCFKATEGFLAEFGANRVIDSPLCETGIVGTAVGMAMAGHRVMAEIQLGGFVLPALDQILGHVGRIRFRYQGERGCPILIRLPGGGGWRGHEFHMDSTEAIFTQAPGTFVLASSSPAEAKGLLLAALEHPDPVVFLEPVSLYRTQRGEVPTGHYTIPLGRAQVAREGQDVTLVTYGRHVPIALGAAERAHEQEGLSVEVVNLRTLRPWDEQTVFASVAKTRRLVTVHDAHRSSGVGAEIAARVSEELLDSLAAPVVRVAGFDANRPSLRSETIADIDADWILGALRRAADPKREIR
jgi:2-oxoisovalerate dehydrogenase E1 component